MACKSAEECMNRILRDIDKLRDVDFGDRNSLRRYNAAMRRIAEHVAQIDSGFPDQLELFAVLCEHPDPFVVECCARRVFELEHTTMDYKRRAMNALFRRLEDTQSKTEKEFFITEDLMNEIETDFPDALERFMSLLDSKNLGVVYWCGDRILNSGFPGRDVKLLALKRLDALNQDPEYPAYYKIMLSKQLEQWRKELQ